MVKQIPFVADSPEKKVIRSNDFNLLFRKDDGLTLTWGERFEDDPQWCPFGPILLDIEISTICTGGCKFCYKSNTASGKNMTAETYRQILDKMPPTVTQVALGIGSIDANPDLPAILQITRDKGIVPNITINGHSMTPDRYDLLANLCGAVAVSHYDDRICGEAVKSLRDRGLKQVNMHKLLSEETFASCMDICANYHEYWSNVHAVVFLLAKPKGRAKGRFRPVSQEKFNMLVELCLSNNVPLGFDSCSCPMLFTAVKGKPEAKKIAMLAEPCESFGLFSGYISVDGIYFPCSFAEGEGDWQEGIDVVNCNSFLEDVWYSEKVERWRAVSLNATRRCDCEMSGKCRVCPIFDLSPCYRRDR